MTKKKIIIPVVVGVISVSGLFTLFSLKKVDNVKAQLKVQSKPEVKEEKQNLALKIALNDFKNLDEFNTKFFDTPDEAWMIPDVSDEGSNDGGNSHGWTTIPTKEKAHDENILDMNTGKVVYTIKASDGATAGDIRKALAERNNTQKD